MILTTIDTIGHNRKHIGPIVTPMCSIVPIVVKKCEIF